MTPGDSLGPYRILGKVGEGGMGEVYRARDTRLDRDVAIKVLPDGLASDRARRARFEREARAVSSLNHPNICTLHDVGQDGDITFLVMELVEGQTLAERVAGGALPQDEVVSIGVQLADGLAVAHARGIIHRDLKPANLKTTPDGRLKILDFGLAKNLTAADEPGVAETTLAATRSLDLSLGVAGTLPYMAPEQVAGERCDQRTDIHAAGAVLYELSTGRRPFASREPAALVAEIAAQRPAPPRQLNAGVTPQLEAVILRCLEKSPAERYQTAQDLARDLRGLAAGNAPRPGPGPSVPVSRGRRWPWAAAAVLVVAAGATLWSLMSNRADSGTVPPAGSTGAVASSVAVLPFVNMSGNPDNEYLGDGISEEVINAVARTGRIDVVARTSAFSFKGKNVDVREIARQLGVQVVLEGSVRQAGDRLRVTAQLVKAADGYHIWSETFDRPAADIFAIQDDIARAVVLQVVPSAGADPSPGAPLTSDLKAYDHFLRGRHAYGTWTVESLNRAERELRTAVEIDPEFGAAWALLGETLITQVERLGMGDAAEVYSRVETAAARALGAARPAQAEGYAVRAHVLIHQLNYREAEATARLAIAKNPGSSVAIQWLGYVQYSKGDLVAARQNLGRSLQLDPLSPAWNRTMGGFLTVAGFLDEGRAALQRSQTLDGIEPFELLTLNAVRRRDFTDARALLDRHRDQGLTRVLHAYVDAAEGKIEDARRALAANPPLQMAERSQLLAYLAVGDRERALSYIDSLPVTRLEPILVWRFLPEYRLIADEPRWKTLLARAGLE